MPQVDPSKPRFWRSVEDWKAGHDRPKAAHGYPELVGREFPVGATEMDGHTRREMLKLVGLTAAGSLAASCMRNPPEKILPYVRQPADIRPGQPLHYATSTTLDGFGMGLLVTSREGRPIKVEGNPDHPATFGASGTYEQALAYGVYDPQRGKALKVDKLQSGWKTFLAEVKGRTQAWKLDGGKKLRFLDGPTASPFDAWLRKQIKAALPQATFSTFAGLDRDSIYDGTNLAFGQPLDVRYDLDRARVIVALDDDLIEHGPDRLVHARDFARHRTPEPENAELESEHALGEHNGPPTRKADVAIEPARNASPPPKDVEPGHGNITPEEMKSRGLTADGKKQPAGTDSLINTTPEQVKGVLPVERGTGATGWMNRLYVAECGFSVTGTQADHRLRVRSSEIAALTAALYAQVVPGAAGDVAGLAAMFKDSKWVAAVAKDLLARGAEAVVTVGCRQPAEVHAMVAAINAALKSEVVSYHKPVLLDTRGGASVLADLIKSANAGDIDTLVITAWNPVYSAPADLDLISALQKIPNVIYFGQFEDETYPYARWFIPAAHDLESWGDSASIDGTIAIQQPLVAPLFDGVPRAELFAAFAGLYDRSAHELLKTSHAETYAAPTVHGGPNAFETWWEQTVQKGVLPPEPPQAVTAALNSAGLADRLRSFKFEKTDGIEINYIVDNKVHDGRFGDNAWLQELPDPLTKVTWGNTAQLSPKTAERLGLEAEDIVLLTVGKRQLRATVYVLPGHADEACSIAIGYGRTGGEEIARGVGSNTNLIRTTAFPWFGDKVTFKKTGDKDKLGITQEHWAMEGRPIALVAELRDVQKKHLPLIEENNGPNPSMMDEFTERSGDGYLWAMAIDMSKCTGCNACILACESENNILVVGKDQVRRGREMHWLRIDRYFEGDLEEPQVVVQPMACVQCEKAPCEYVCPVNATVHSDEGLNDMVYNRCVGTRYCANNCPYKVRRFNYLNWKTNDPSEGGRPGLQGTLEMKMNPDVTVRARGVMEKCTYCVQRIEQARIATRIENKGFGRTIRDGEVVTACQQSCASGAITFGSLHDPKSEVSKKHKDERAYQVLWELNTRPRTRHLAKVRNPNPELV